MAQIPSNRQPKSHVIGDERAPVIGATDASRLMAGEKPRGSLVTDPFGEREHPMSKPSQSGGSTGFIDTTKEPLRGPLQGSLMQQGHFGPQGPAVPSQGSMFAREQQQHKLQSAFDAGHKPGIDGAPAPTSTSHPKFGETGATDYGVGGGQQTGKFGGFARAHSAPNPRGGPDMASTKAARDTMNSTNIGPSRDPSRSPEVERLMRTAL